MTHQRQQTEMVGNPLFSMGKGFLTFTCYTYNLLPRPRNLTWIPNCELFSHVMTNSISMFSHSRHANIMSQNSFQPSCIHVLLCRDPENKHFEPKNHRLEKRKNHLPCTSMTLASKSSFSRMYPPQKTNITMENPPFEDVFPVENSVIFQCHVSFPGCTPLKINMEPENEPLKEEIPFGKHHFQVPYGCFQKSWYPKMDGENIMKNPMNKWDDLGGG